MIDAIPVVPRRLHERIALTLVVLAICIAVFAPRGPCDSPLLLIIFPAFLLFDLQRCVRLLIHADAPLMAIDEEGLRLNPALFAGGLLPWSDVDRIKLVLFPAMPAHPQAEIHLRPTAALAAWRGLSPFGWGRRIIVPAGISGAPIAEIRAFQKCANALAKSARRAARDAAKRVPAPL